jgi:hypothetical protein
MYSTVNKLRRVPGRRLLFGARAARYLTRRPTCTREDQVSGSDTILGTRRNVTDG